MAKEIEHEHTMAFGESREEIAPEIGRCEGPVNEDYWLARASRARGVTVDPTAVQIDELSPQGEFRGDLLRLGAMRLDAEALLCDMMINLGVGEIDHKQKRRRRPGGRLRGLHRFTSSWAACA